MVRQAHTQTIRLDAHCRDCEWKTEAHNGMGNAARHHDATGHTVLVEVDRLVVYGDPSTVPPGQTSLLDENTATA